jgi:hypothetical protein
MIIKTNSHLLTLDGPNCHAQTETYCGKNKGNYPKDQKAELAVKCWQCLMQMNEW